jgi:predicted RNase H-like HicB family nuclease
MTKINIFKKYKGARLPLIVEKDEGGFYIVECPLFDGCYTQGKTIDEALKNIREVLELVLQEKENQEILKCDTNKELSLHTITL